MIKASCSRQVHTWPANGRPASISYFLHKVKSAGLASILAVTLAACGGAGEESEAGGASSSSSSSSSASSSSSSSSGTPGVELDGAQLYLEKGCLACHGADGLQKSQPIVFDNYTLPTLIAKIDRDMPTLNPSSCVGDCAEAVGEYLWSLRPVVSCDTGEQVLPRRLRLLTKFEYANTVNDLFGRTDGDSLSSAVGTDTEVRGFDNNASANAVTIARMDGYWAAAEAVAKAVDVNKWLGSCGQNAADCFVTNFGRDAFRRPLTSQEKSDYMSLFSSGATPEAGARYVVQTMLASPNFLYRTELGENGRLTQYEVASLLSYTFWGSMPDANLFTRAANNGLSNTDQIKQAVETLVADPKAQKQFAHFGRQWLHLEPVAGVDRDTQLFPSFNAQVAEAMDAELEMFLQEVLLKDGYTMADLFKSDFTFANQALAGFYGINGVSGSQMSKVAVNDQRGGILFMGALLTRNSKFDESHPIKRGLIVRRNLLCQEFGVPPANIGEVEPFDPSKPTRERFAAHSANEACAACHQFIDEVGFAFENYDAVGSYRTAEANGASVDASGTISGLNRMTDDDEHMFFDLKGLSDILAGEGLQPTSACVAEQFQRMMEGVAEPDACALANTVSRWNPAANSIKDLWVEIVASQTFMQRQ